MANAPDPKTDSRLIVKEPSENPLVMQVTAGVVALRTDPSSDAIMTSQALHGEQVELHREDGEYGFVQCRRDKYTGWALMEALSAPTLKTTHRVSALRTYAYSEPDLKQPPYYLLSLNSEIVRVDENNGYIKDDRGGWISTKHLTPVGELENDPAAVAERFIGTPYLWGGRESLGLDCSGLTVAAYGACGVVLPRDSDMQFSWCGDTIPNWEDKDALQSGDLVFWKGHVGIMTSASQIIHSNAYHMATAKEPLSGAIERIAKHYGEPIGARRIVLSKERERPFWMLN